MEKIASPGRTREILERHGFTIKKSFGQNFLIDGNVMEKIISAAEITKEDFVVEIGPGLGGLTQYLAESAGRVLAVEIDKTAVPILQENLAGYDNVEILCADILKTDLNEIPGEIKVVANLPYYITTPVIMRLLETGKNIRSITVMVQKEVAERLSAAPGTDAYGAITLAAGYYSDTVLEFIVSPSCFLPRPKVESAVLTLKILDEPRVSVPDEGLLFNVIKCAFGQRRKTLVNGLYNLGGFGLSKEALAGMLSGLGFDPRVRGETLSLSDFARITEKLYNR